MVLYHYINMSKIIIKFAIWILIKYPFLSHYDIYSNPRYGKIKKFKIQLI